MKPTEKLRKGDLYRRGTNGEVRKLLWNNPETAGSYSRHKFWRRRHTKYVPPTAPKPKRRIDPQVGVGGTAKVKKVQVEFDYPHDGRVITREVQLISLDDKYLTGLEIGARWDTEDRQWKTSYQFKKFRRDRIKAGGQIYLSEFK